MIDVAKNKYHKSSLVPQKRNIIKSVERRYFLKSSGALALLGSLFSPPATAWASELLRLNPLPKRHYYWPTFGKWPTDFHAEQIVRITRTASLSGEHEKEADAKKMLQWAKTHDAVVGINYSIWARVFPKDAAPTESYEAAVKELKIFADRLQLIKSWANQYAVPVGAILLDSEVFRVQANDPTSAWNRAITQKYDAAYMIAKRIFPNAVVEWWGSGWQRSAAPSGWSVSPHFTFTEKRDSLSCSLYSVPEIEGMRETYRRTVELADSLNIQRVTPWVALACGFRRDMEVMQKWSDHWDYDVIYDWTLGRELNIRWFGDRPERFSHYNRAEHVVFYPQPYRNPDWEKHFIAYVLGASGAKKLSLNS